MKNVVVAVSVLGLVFHATGCGMTPTTIGQAGNAAVTGSGSGSGNGGGAGPTSSAGTGTTTGGGSAPMGNAGSGPLSPGGMGPGGAGPAGSGPVGGMGPMGGANPGGMGPMGGTDPGGGGASAGTTSMSGAGAGGGPVVPKPGLILSSEGSYWQTSDLAEGGTAADITVDDTQEEQDWHGWGGTFNERGWDALLELSEADRQQAIRLLFDKNDGAGFTWGRIPIGASDYAMDRYTLNDTPGDLEMNSFSIARDEELLIPYILAAKAVKSDIKFWGSPWTPPPWMKDNNEYDQGMMINEEENLDAYALYLVKWIQAYEAAGIPIDHVHPQNEPGWAQNYPSCAWGPSWRGNDGTVLPGTAFLGDFVVNNLSDAISTAGLSTKIWYGTFSNDGVFEDYWANLSTEGRGLVTGVALQWETVGRVSTVKSAAPNLLVMQSEHRCGNYPWAETMASSAADANRDNFLASAAPNNYAYGEESWDLIYQWINNGVNIYSAWNMVLDTEGFSMDEVRPWPQNALLVVNRDGNTLIPTPAYYVFRHLAQYTEPGAKRVATTGGQALAFKNPDGSIMVAIHNTGAQDAPTTVSVGGTLYQFTIPGAGFATVNWVP